MMKLANIKSQSGFFDLGISFLILALSGTAAYVTVSEHREAGSVALQAGELEVAGSEPASPISQEAE